MVVEHHRKGGFEFRCLLRDRQQEPDIRGLVCTGSFFQVDVDGVIFTPEINRFKLSKHRVVHMVKLDGFKPTTCQGANGSQGCGEVLSIENPGVVRICFISWCVIHLQVFKGQPLAWIVFLKPGQGPCSVQPIPNGFRNGGDRACCEGPGKGQLFYVDPVFHGFEWTVI